MQVTQYGLLTGYERVDRISIPGRGTDIYTAACRTTLVAKGACSATGAREGS